MVVHVCGFMAHCPFMYACTDCRTVVSISCTVVHICMYNIAWRTRAHRPRTGRCAKFHFSLRNFLLPDCTTKVVTKYIFYENFSKFGRIKSKLMKKIWALRARNSDLGQPMIRPAMTRPHAHDPCPGGRRPPRPAATACPMPGLFRIDRFVVYLGSGVIVLERGGL